MAHTCALRRGAADLPGSQGRDQRRGRVGGGGTCCSGCGMPTSAGTGTAIRGVAAAPTPSPCRPITCGSSGIGASASTTTPCGDTARSTAGDATPARIGRRPSSSPAGPKQRGCQAIGSSQAEPQPEPGRLGEIRRDEPLTADDVLFAASCSTCSPRFGLCPQLRQN